MGEPNRNWERHYEPMLPWSFLILLAALAYFLWKCLF